MYEDDIIEELHEIRRRLIEKAGGTIEAYHKQVMEQQRLHPEGLVDFSKTAKLAKSKSRLRSAKPAKPRTKVKTPDRKPKSWQRRKAVATLI